MPGSTLASTAAAARVRAAAKRSPVSSGVARVPFSAPLPLPKVLLCDLDGTLIDSMPALAELATEVMEDVLRDAAHRWRASSTSRRAGCRSSSSWRRSSRATRATPAPSADVRGREAGPLRGAIRMSAETRRALEEMRDLGVRIAVSSNNGIDNVTRSRASRSSTSTCVLGYGDGLAKGKPHLDASSRASSAPPARRCCSSAIRCTTARSRSARASRSSAWRRRSRPSGSRCASRPSRCSGVSRRCPELFQ